MSEAHPFAVKRTELIWEGKYDADGRRVPPLLVELPVQTVEMVNESAQDRQRALLLLESPNGYQAKEFSFTRTVPNRTSSDGSTYFLSPQFSRLRHCLKVKQSEYMKLQADTFADLGVFGQNVLGLT